MPDETIARLDERLKAHGERLARQENACRDLAAKHVESSLYASEMHGLRDELRALRRDLATEKVDREKAQAKFETRVQKAQDDTTATRRWLVMTVLSGAAIVATVLVAVLT